MQGHATVQLRHDLPDGSWHVDWLIAQDRAGAARLIAFRVPRRLDALAPGETVDAVRLEDHRPVYLAYEGPISRDRGTVVRLARGIVVAAEMATRRWRLEIAWLDAGGRQSPQSLRVEHEAGERWRITAL
jgi:hypothetical protein